MAVSVTLPALGESVTEGTVTRWLKQVGETVAADEPLLEVSTDKVDTEIPSPSAGVLLEIKVAEDETVEVGAELAVIGEEGESAGSGDQQDQGGQDQASAPDQGDQQGQPDQQPGNAPQAEAAPQAEGEQAASGTDQPLEPEPAAEGGYGRPDPADEAPAPQRAAGGSQQGGVGAQADSQQGDGQQAGGAQAGGAQAGGAQAGGAQAGGIPVLLPALGESVTEGTVTRWLKQVGDEVQVDEPLLEVSTDKVDTEIPAPAAGVLLEIKVAEDETVDVGTELAVIGAAGSAAPAQESTPAPDQDAASEQPDAAQAAPAQDDSALARDEEPPAKPEAEPLAQEVEQHAAAEAQSEQRTQDGASAAGEGSGPDDTAVEAVPFQGAPEPSVPAQSAPAQSAPAQSAPAQSAPAEKQSAAPAPNSAGAARTDSSSGASAAGSFGDGAAYVTPLVRRLANEHNVDLSSLTGTGVGGRIRKQDVLAAAEAAKTPPAPEPTPEPAAQPAQPAQPTPATAGRAAQAPSPLRGTTQKMNRRRQTIARRMVESLQVSAQLTTVVEVDITAVAHLRTRAKADFERREGVKLSFLPFFAKAALEALKVYPQVNATINSETSEVTYFDTEHLGVAVDTEAGLVVPVIRDAGDLNIAGIARKIADVAERTRTNKITPDELSGGTFTLTNTGSRGALFDTPIINQPQVGILGTGSVVKRPVVIQDAYGADSIAIRSMVYLALTYDHRLVDGADAARFLGLVKQRLEEGAFEGDLGL